MAKYTESEWRWLNGTLVAGKQQTHILYTQEPPGLGSQADAVKDLIASAPDLFVAVRAKIEATYRDDHERADRMLSEAFKKAIGAVNA